MTGLTPLAREIETATREGACACGASIHQDGVRITERWTWSPTRCPACAERYLDDRRQDATKERLEDAEDAVRRKARSVAEALRSLQVPPKYADESLETFVLHGNPEDRALQMRLLTIARRYLTDWPQPPHMVLIFLGGPGTGKGHLVYSIAKAVAGESGAVRVVKLSDMVRRLRASWRSADAEAEESVLRDYRHLDLLVIDEVSRHAFYGEQIHQHLYDVIDHRIEYNRPTILTTNETELGIREILRPALWDRVHGSGGVVEFGNSSFRARAR